MKECQCLRAHHMMCLAYFKGKGYSDEFAAHMSVIKEQLKSDPLIKLVVETDLICKECPNNKKGVCLTEEKVREYDKKLLVQCDLAENMVMRYSDIERLVYDNILLNGNREKICGDCEWSELCRLGCEQPLTLSCFDNKIK